MVLFHMGAERLIEGDWLVATGLVARVTELSATGRQP
jgi:hypothetical protein